MEIIIEIFILYMSIIFIMIEIFNIIKTKYNKKQLITAVEIPKEEPKQEENYKHIIDNLYISDITIDEYYKLTNSKILNNKSSSSNSLSSIEKL